MRRGAAVAVATLALAGVTAGVAFAAAPVTSRDEALAAVTAAQGDLTTAQGRLDSVKAYLATLPTTPPPTTTTPPPAPVAVAAVATVVSDQAVKVDWTTTRTDITGWTVGRDGTDRNGTGPWSGPLPANATTQTFNLLRAATAYTFTVTPITAAGPLAPAVVTATTTGVVTPPPTGTGTEAAVKYNWGAAVPAFTDEFNYVGAPDAAKWYNPGSGAACWSGHDGNGKRCGDRSTVDGAKLVMTGLANGDTGLIGQLANRQYGRWEMRVRSENTGAANGREYHPLGLIWPTSEAWPRDGEYDFLENGKPGAACAEAYIHYPHPNLPVQQQHAVEQNCGAPLSEWHNVAFEWAPEQVSGYIDGVEFFRYSGGANSSRSAIQSMPSGKLVLQFDNFFGGNMTPAKYEVDWVRGYNLP